MQLHCKGFMSKLKFSFIQIVHYKCSAECLFHLLMGMSFYPAYVKHVTKKQKKYGA